LITIKEVAKRANVSSAPVSRMLNDSGYVSEEARERILKVIEETGYVPSENAKSLRTKKTKVIGVILPKLGSETGTQGQVHRPNSA
jgi:LacI family transcriptional regulator, sucrose operon repressor